VSEGQLEWEAGWTWYRVAGDLGGDGKTPLVLLHGGPGAAHDYLESLTELADVAARPCVIYDQLGCGRSQHLPQAGADFWTVDLFRRELTAMLDHLGISDRYHVLG
jgi:L-proline amide hydrolase